MNALFYPFHLCHEHTLKRLLEEYQTVHFRDFMALQLTPMMGTTAFPDRMGDHYPDFLKTGRIAQGYQLSGPMTPDTILAVNRDLADTQWRRLFQDSMLNDQRFQRGLSPELKDSTVQPTNARQDLNWLQYRELRWAGMPFTVEAIQALSRQRLNGKNVIRFEYGWALIKTAASLIYTIQLCHQLNLIAITDSQAHYNLLTQNCEREQISLKNKYVKRGGY